MVLNVMWFRRDLRLKDNAALYYALRSDNPVLPLFIFDKTILDALDDEHDRRVEFIYLAIKEMQEELEKIGSTLEVIYDHPEKAFKELLSKYKIDKVFANEDYEPAAIERDEAINQMMKDSGGSFHTFKDQVIFSKDEILKDDGQPYTVYTPYSRKWREKLNPFYLKSYSTKKYFENFHKQKPKRIPSLKSMGFKNSLPDDESEAHKLFPSKTIKKELITKYDKQRDFPGLDATSRLGVHLRFGTISIRELASKAGALNNTYLNELIWRDFYQMIMYHFPHVGKGHAFKPAYDHIKWRNDEKEFEAWCNGATGYPIVDAGMRQLNETGFMHNRVRMITASFLAKHLLIDWRWGEAYFAKKLLDYDLAANNGGWQWSAGSGCDAAPYFRVFNPRLQTEKFDKDLQYIKQWVPEFESPDYPKPIVEHDMARKRALEAYKTALDAVK